MEGFSAEELQILVADRHQLPGIPMDNSPHTIYRFKKHCPPSVREQIRQALGFEKSMLVLKGVRHLTPDQCSVARKYMLKVEQKGALKLGSNGPRKIQYKVRSGSQ